MRTLLLFIVTRNSSFPYNNGLIIVIHDSMPCDCVNGPTLEGLPFALGVEVNALKTNC